MHFFFKGLLAGAVIAVPVGPIGLLCITRALSWGAPYGLISGLGVATADAVAAAIAAFGWTLMADFLAGEQKWLRLMSGLFFLYLGSRLFRAKPLGRETVPARQVGLATSYASMFFLTLTNPVTLLSFIAMFAGLGVEKAGGNYLSAASLTLGVFVGSALWWVVLESMICASKNKFDSEGLRWISRVAGAIIVVFGCVVIFHLYQNWQ